LEFSFTNYPYFFIIATVAILSKQRLQVIWLCDSNFPSSLGNSWKGLLLERRVSVVMAALIVPPHFVWYPECPNWAVMKPLGGESYGWFLGHWKHAFEGDCGAPVPSFLPFTSCPWGEQFALSHVPHHCYLASPMRNLKAIGVPSHGMKPLKLRAKETFSLIS
jgi:hypothetical protein